MGHGTGTLVLLRADVIGAINEEDDYTKTRNYWKYLKGKLRKENPELVSATNQLKLLAADGKRYSTDTLDALIDKTTDREIFMKGIDYSYYYEQEE